MTPALVVFSGAAPLWWLRLLKPGFRHCFVALASPSGWLMVEPMSHYTMVAHLPVPAGFDLAGWYRARGFVVVETWAAEPPRRPAPWRPYSCVESVKRVLGVRAGGVLTPWQLFRHLTVIRKKDLDGAEFPGYNPIHQHQNCARLPPDRTARRFLCAGRRNKAGS